MPTYVCVCGLPLYPHELVLEYKDRPRTDRRPVVFDQTWAHFSDESAHLLLTNDPEEIVDFEMLLPAGDEEET